MFQKRKIILIYSEPFSGVWTYLSIATLTVLKKRNVQLCFLYLQVGKSLLYELLLDFFVQKKCFCLPKNKNLRLLARFYPLHLLLNIRKLCRKNDFICAHSLTTGNILSNILWLWPSKVPLIYTIHDLIPHEGARVSLISRYMTHTDQRNIMYLPILATCSQAQQKKAKEVYPDKKAFLRAKSPLKQKLVIAGAGSYNPLDGIFNPNVIFVNRHIEYAEVRSLFENARCVVYSYTSITQMAVVQFPYYFKDCIVDGKTGFLFENGTIEPLFKLLEYVCSDQFDSELTKFSMAEQYEKCYSEDTLGNVLVEMSERVRQEWETV